ncbi:MAG TPA: acyl-CoA dehydrogenase family protein [Candidatus Nitrosopolaris sp.]|nr:acyl-CoA dehydrogenase family protein [Candidatus Nitrosopolaris sp.]
MDLTFGPEQESIRDAIRGVLADRIPAPRARAELAPDPGLWAEAAALGWFGLGLPEAVGGAGYALPEETILFVELGRSLAAGPWLGTVLATHALTAVPALRDDLASVVGGRTRVAVVDDPADALGDATRPTGTVRGVADGDGVDAFLVLGGRRVRWVSARASGVRVAARESLDPTRRVADLSFTEPSAELLGAEAIPLRRTALVLVAAEALGIAERTLEASVAHAKTREQFGRPIGSFQAVKHRCADMAVRTEVARSIVTFAAVALRDLEPEAPRHAQQAKVLATSAALANGHDNVQNHGGMGFTWEADAHLFLKRAWMLEHAFGTRTAHLEALAAPWRAG